MQVVQHVPSCPHPFRSKLLRILVSCIATVSVASSGCSDPPDAPTGDRTPSPMDRDSGVRPLIDAGQGQDGEPPPLDAGLGEADGGEAQPDGGQFRPDGGQFRPDGGQFRPDGGRPGRDAGQSVPDAGRPRLDGGRPRNDAGQPAPDGSREDILADIVGFGEGTTGGAGGSLCRVTNLRDSGSGSLRDCAGNSSPTWIVFDVSGNIDLSSAIRLRSNTTIDGRGQDVAIRGFGLQLRRIENVVLHNLRFSEGSDDAIMIRDGTDHVWVDHVSLSGFGDGLIDITNAATDVTVSWCELTGHDKVMLISANPGDSQDVAIRVTLHHNYFHDTVQRHPRMRWGRIHSFNNYIVDWSSYGAGSSQRAQFLSERNVYEAGSNRSAIIADSLGSDPEAGDVRIEGDLFLNGANGEERNPGSVFTPGYAYSAATANTALIDAVRSGAGWQSVPLP